MKYFVIDIDKQTISNKNYRKVLYTTTKSQVVLMSLKPKQEIGKEKHNGDQFFRIEKGSGLLILNGKKFKIKAGSAFVIPKGKYHNVINNGKSLLKLYTIYTPPQHKDKLVQKNKPSND